MTTLLDPPARAARPAGPSAVGARLRVLEVRPGCSVQDPGRPGLAHLGVTASGPVDRAAFATANRLVGNPPEEAAIEVTLGGLAVVLDTPRWVAVTGAPVPVTLDGRPVADPRCLRVPAGAELRLGTPRHGLRSYLAVGGGVRPAPVLGSRARDSLTGLGPPVVGPGADLPLGPAPGEPPAVPVELVAPRLPGPGTRVRFHWGPRDAVLGPADRSLLRRAAWRVSGHCDRVGIRLTGATLAVGDRSLPSEGVPLGAIQVPPSGEPILFLADHPVTGGYPVVGVVADADIDLLGQLRPGDPLRLDAIVSGRDTEG
ncbi:MULTISPECIES: biotin-dependent carboxyltransferase family protein [unclassified Pseudonocardia]|uniref:5-oxoprolinase subunit C family protein n=1 Tax=unclassified Pseudonocardia TaxID=2619320 RepID=UPI001CF64926|nr:MULTISPECIES: biotin-dependent carboxyltransferase family protein [unclassified Pseudonocardia]